MSKPKKTEDESEDKDTIFNALYPILAERVDTYNIEPFIPIDIHDTEERTDVADLAVVNNFLAVCDKSLTYVRTIENLCSLSGTVLKLIEARRKVKKLPYGKEQTKGGRVFEIVE